MKERSIVPKAIVNHLHYLLLPVILLALACTKSTDLVSSPTTKVPLWALLPVTGESPINGTAQQAAAELAETDINAYLTSINSPARIDVVIKDTKGYLDEENRLITATHDSGSAIAVCGMTSGSLSLLKSVIDANGTIFLSEASTAPGLSVDDNLFRLVPDDRVTAGVMADVLREQGIETIFIMYRNDWWGIELAQELALNFISKGGAVADSIVYSFRLFAADVDEKVALLNTSVTTALHVDSLDAAKVAVVLFGFEEGIEVLRKASAASHLSRVKWYTGDGLGQNDDLLLDDVAAAFAATVGLSAPLIAEVETPAYQNLMTRIEEKTGVAHYAFAPVLYDAVWLAALTLLEGGTPAELKTRLLEKAKTHAAVTGPIDFNAAGDRAFGSYDFWKVEAAGTAYKWVKSVAAHESGTAAAAKRLITRWSSEAQTEAVFQVGTVPYKPSVVVPEPTVEEFLETIRLEQLEQKR